MKNVWVLINRAGVIAGRIAAFLSRWYVKLFSSRITLCVILGWLALGLVLVAFLPQEQGAAWYYESLPEWFAGMVLTCGWDSFHASPFFVLPAVLFALACLTMIIREFHPGETWKNPFILGTGFLLLGVFIVMVAGLITTDGREEVREYLAEGDAISLVDGSRLVVEKVLRTEVEEGAEADTETLVLAQRPSGLARRGRVAVHRPFMIGTIAIHQSGWREEPILTMIDQQGKSFTVQDGEWFTQGSFTMYFRLAKPVNRNLPEAYFEVQERNHVIGKMPVETGANKLGYVSRGISFVQFSELTVVFDPGKDAAFAGFIFIVFGTLVTALRRIFTARTEGP